MTKIRDSQFVVIVPYYQGQQYLDSLIKSIPSAVRVIIVNNDKKPLERQYDPRIIEVDTQPNIGYGRAVNVGVRTANELGFKYCFVLNQDSFIRRLDLSVIKQILGSYPQSILVPRITKYESDDMELHLKAVYDTGTMVLKTPCILQEIDFIGLAGFAMVIESAVALGPFEPLFYMYYEDNDIVRRCRLLGGRLLSCDQFTIAHEGSGKRDSEYLTKHSFGFSKLLYRVRWEALPDTMIFFFVTRAAIGLLKRHGPVEMLKLVKLAWLQRRSYRLMRQWDQATISKRVVSDIENVVR